MIKSIRNLDDYGLIIKWRLTDCCNYKCSYCIRNTHDSISNVLNDEQVIIDNVPEVSRIIKEKNMSTKIQLVGGEPSLLNLPRIILELFKGNEDLIKEINITTNFSNSVEYYNRLFCLCNNLGLILSMTCSFHSEFVDLDKFIAKIRQLKTYESSVLKVEMVSLDSNKNLVDRFVSLCDKYNIIYTVDPNFRSDKIETLVSKSSDKKNDLFEVCTDTEMVYCKSVRELARRFGNGKKLDLKGYRCTLDNNFIKLYKDMHIGFVVGKSGCRNKQPISEFHINEVPHYCNDGCSFCGSMNAYKE